MMRSFSVAKTVALGAGATSENLVNGTRLSPVLGDGYLTLWVTSTVADIDMTLLIQSENVCDGFEVSNANRYPIKDEDWALENIPVERNEVVDLRFTDRGGSGATVTYIIAFTPRGVAIGSGRRR